MKTMVIGLGPDYNYKLEDHDIWLNNNTKYASNHGASLISRTLIKYFDADFIDDFSKIDSYRKTYDLCVVALATHVTEWRDVSEYSNFVKELGIKTVAFSLGIQDYSAESSKLSRLHPSIKDMIQYAIESSGFVGVRGPHTASLLLKNGIKAENIRRIGCPTIFGPLNRDLKIEKKPDFKNPLIVYHRTMAELNLDVLSSAPYLGQDFLDEVIFDPNISSEHPIKKEELEEYAKLKNGDLALQMIKERGIFHSTFDEWFNEIGKYDFVFGPRLHGCIAAIIQGIPAVMLARDIRVQEIAEFYSIPYLRYEEVGSMTINEIYDYANYYSFNNKYSQRYDNFVKLLSDIKVKDYLSFKINTPYKSEFPDRSNEIYLNLLFDEINKLKAEISYLKRNVNANSQSIDASNKRFRDFLDKLKSIPGVNLIKKITE